MARSHDHTKVTPVVLLILAAVFIAFTMIASLATNRQSRTVDRSFAQIGPAHPTATRTPTPGCSSYGQCRTASRPTCCSGWVPSYDVGCERSWRCVRPATSTPTRTRTPTPSCQCTTTYNEEGYCIAPLESGANVRWKTTVNTTCNRLGCSESPAHTGSSALEAPFCNDGKICEPGNACGSDWSCVSANKCTKTTRETFSY